MRKKVFEQFQSALIKRGYHKYEQNLQHEDYILGKGFHKEDNSFEESRSAYQILLYIYDWSDKLYFNLPKEIKDRVGIEAHIMVSRTSDERIDMIIPFHKGDSIKFIEDVAESYYKWVMSIWSTPREEKQ